MVGWFIGLWLGINVIFVWLLILRALRRERLRESHPWLFDDDDQVPELQTKGITDDLQTPAGRHGR